jgi:potassium/chloride transporter 4/5/6
VQLSTLKGVFLPCIQNILGVILFVRVPWITGQAGVGLTLLIIFMAVLCTFLTTISMAAIATNGIVPAGGAYYMISRSLGKEVGGSVGILFYLTTAVATAMYVLGAVEVLTVSELVATNDTFYECGTL